MIIQVQLISDIKDPVIILILRYTLQFDLLVITRVKILFRYKI